MLFKIYAAKTIHYHTYNKYKKYILLKFYINDNLKMTHIVEYIIEINSLN